MDKQDNIKAREIKLVIYPSPIIVAFIRIHVRVTIRIVVMHFATVRWSVTQLLLASWNGSRVGRNVDGGIISRRRLLLFCLLGRRLEDGRIGIDHDGPLNILGCPDLNLRTRSRE